MAHLPHQGPAVSSRDAPSLPKPKRRRDGDRPTGADEPAGLFATDHLIEDLRLRSVRGGAITVVGQGIRSLVNVASLAVLARLVSEEDFGLVFAVTAVTSILGTVSEFGLATATQQRAEITHAQVSALFWVNVATSLVAGLLIAMLAPAVAHLYGHDPRIPQVMLAYAAVSLFSGLGIQHRALLRRQMRFRPLAVVDIASLVLGRGIAIGAAWHGAGHWALVAQSAVITLASTAGAWFACRWRPGMPARPSDVLPLLAFGKNLAFGRLVVELSRNADKILLQRFGGYGATGLYGNALRLLTWPAENLSKPLTAVAIPALSRLQGEPKRFRRYYQRALLLLTTATMPIVVFAFVDAEPIVVTLLGPPWIEAAVLFRLLAPAALIRAFGPATAWVYTALGRTDRQLRWITVSSLVRVSAVAVGVFWGARGVAAATSIVACALRGEAIAYCVRDSPIRARHLLQAVWRPATAAVLAGALLLAVVECLAPTDQSAVGVLRDLGIFALAYLTCWIALPGGRTAFAQVTRLAAELRRRRAATSHAVGERE